MEIVKLDDTRKFFQILSNLFGTDPFGHGIDLLEFKGRGYDEILQPQA